jgi:hypothetical protein
MHCRLPAAGRLGNGVMAMSAPRMTFGNPFNGKPEAFYRPVFLESFDAILRTGRSKTALGTQPWRNDELIYFYKSYKWSGKYFF